jgi:hypothetical protein
MKTSVTTRRRNKSRSDKLIISNFLRNAFKADSDGWSLRFYAIYTPGTQVEIRLRVVFLYCPALAESYEVPSTENKIETCPVNSESEQAKTTNFLK